MAEPVFVAKLGDIPDGDSRVVEAGGREVAVFRVGDDYFAIDDRCPHAGASLSGGHVEDGYVTCPWHYWRFRLCDGTWADYTKVKTGSYPVRIDNGGVWVEVPDKTSPGGSP